MPTIRANGIEIYHEVDGPDDAPALLLVNGYRSQLISWYPELIELLIRAGFRVVRFDNRDVGLTEKTPGDPPAVVTSSEGLPELSAPPPYTLADMAADGMELLSALGIDRAHIAGASMGGMIVQRMAIDHPNRVLSLTSIMSTTGDRSVGQATPEAIAALMSPTPSDRDAYIENNVRTWRIISGPHFDEGRTRERSGEAYDRCFYPQGAVFQMAAVMSDGDRTAALRNVRCPTLVIHGRVDPLVTLSGGEATARAVPGADLLVIDDMGHDLPPQIAGRVVDAIARNAARATATA